MNIYEAFQSGSRVIRRKAWCEDINLVLSHALNDRFDFSKEDILADDWEALDTITVNRVDVIRAWKRSLSKALISKQFKWSDHEIIKLMEYKQEVFNYLIKDLNL
jgi:hypothetical protein